MAENVEVKVGSRTKIVRVGTGSAPRNVQVKTGVGQNMATVSASRSTRSASVNAQTTARSITVDGDNGVRYIAKMDTTQNWNNRISYVPPKGEVIVYSDYAVLDGKDVPNIKIGDGNAYLIDLPFVNESLTQEIMAEIELMEDHIRNTAIHVTEEDREFWSSKLNCEVDGGTLVLNRL